MEQERVVKSLNGTSICKSCVAVTFVLIIICWDAAENGMVKQIGVKFHPGCNPPPPQQPPLTSPGWVNTPSKLGLVTHDTKKVGDQCFKLFPGEMKHTLQYYNHNVIIHFDQNSGYLKHMNGANNTTVMFYWKQVLNSM